MAEVQKLRAKRQINDALNTRNGPSTYDVNSLNINDDVLVWREGNTGQPGSWRGPYKLVSIDQESCVLALPHGNTTFRSTSVKPYLIPANQIEGIEIEPAGEEHSREPAEPSIETTENPASLPAKRTRGRPRKHQQITVQLAEAEQAEYQPEYQFNTEAGQAEYQFQASRQAEVLGLLEKGVFEVAHKVPEGIRIFNSRFVNKVKNKGTDKAFMKLRLVV
jgi:hypothetical protein